MNKVWTGSKVGGALFHSKSDLDILACLDQRNIHISKTREGWYRFDYEPTTSWSENEADSSPYTFVLRKGKDLRFMLASTSKEFVFALLDDLQLKSYFASPKINIPLLVEKLMIVPKISDHSLGMVWANVNGYRQDLKTIALFGDNISSTEIFRENIHPKITPYNVSLKVNNGVEVLGISATADVAIPLFNAQAYQRFDDAMRAMVKLGVVEWHLPDFATK